MKKYDTSFKIKNLIKKQEEITLMTFGVECNLCGELFIPKMEFDSMRLICGQQTVAITNNELVDGKLYCTDHEKCVQKAKLIEKMAGMVV